MLVFVFGVDSSLLEGETPKVKARRSGWVKPGGLEGTPQVKAWGTRRRGQIRRRLTRATSKANAGENRRVKPEGIEGTAGSLRRVIPKGSEGIADGAGQVTLEGAGGTTDEGNLGGK